MTQRIRGVIFDAFGTLLQIQQPTHPFRQILKLGIAQGRRPQADDIRTLMSRHLDLKGAAKHFGITLEAQQIKDLEQSLKAELASIKAYPDGLEALHLLREAGIKVSVCSNLAKPYGAAVDLLLPDLDAYGLSFEVGAMKPEKAIYQATVDQMSLDLVDCAMIGDSQRCDRDGPASFGIKGFFLGRDGSGDFSDLMSFAQHILANRGSGL
jgi:FMN phosphatase YigB (HAD superfamily)